MTCQTVKLSAVHQGQIVRLICVANFKVVNPNNDLTYILRSNNVYYRRVLTKISIFLRSIPMDNFNKAQEVGKQRNWNFHCRLCRLLIFATYVNDIWIYCFFRKYLEPFRLCLSV